MREPTSSESQILGLLNEADAGGLRATQTRAGRDAQNKIAFPMTFYIEIAGYWRRSPPCCLGSFLHTGR
jgi:hypothetical protein